MTPMKTIVLTAMIALLPGLAQAKGDLTRKPVDLPKLVLGTQESGYGMSQTEYQLETGVAYSLEIESSGLKEYALKAPEFFASIYLRKVEAADTEIKAVSLVELEFEQAGEIEIYFVPIKPGKFKFFAEGLEHKGMHGVFNVR